VSEELPPVRCDDESTWRHRREKIDLPRLLQLVEENGGAYDLDLHGADLYGLDASPEALRPHIEAYAQEHGADACPPWLWPGAKCGINLLGAHLEHTDLSCAQLQHAVLTGTFLQDCDLRSANLDNTAFARAQMQRAHLGFARLSGSRFWHAHLDGAMWWECSLDRTALCRDQLGRAIGDELAAKGRHSVHHPSTLRTFHDAREVYLALKTNFDSIGRYDDASWAYVKEQQMQKAMHFPTTAGHRWIRRQLRIGGRRWRKKNPGRLRRFLRASIMGRLRWAWLHLLLFVGLRPADFNRATAQLTEEGAEEEHIDRLRWLRNWAYELLTGYGERVYMPVIWAGVVIAVFTCIYAAAGNVAAGDGGGTHNVLTAFTHSIAAFATVGFNTLEPQGWGARLLTAIEAMFGIGLFALIIFTLGNRMRRS